MGWPKASVTFTVGWRDTAWPTTVFWKMRLTGVTSVAAPALAVAVALTERPPAAVAVRICSPRVEPSVQVTAYRPAPSVLPFWGEPEPPWPVGTATLTETPGTPPSALTTLKPTVVARTFPTTPAW